MYIHNLSPIIFEYGILGLRWYGLAYIIGALACLWWLQKNHKHLEMSKEQAWDFTFYVIVGVIAGSRLFLYFWNPQYYFSNFWNIFKIWEGGMSFHGGFIGIIVGGWLYCRKHKLNFWKAADVLSIPTIFALALGRIANFINGELWGRAWDGKWCVNFRNAGGGDVCRHPSTLYAAGKRFIVFGWLLFLHYKNLLLSFTPGFIFWNFVFWEGLGRIIVDFYRENALFLGFSLGQWFSLAMVIAAIYIFNKKYKQDWKKVLGKDIQK